MNLSRLALVLVTLGAGGCGPTTSAPVDGALGRDSGVDAPPVEDGSTGGDGAPGSTCDGDAECASASCVGGVCCEGSCEGLCAACRPGTGACEPSPQGASCGAGLACDGRSLACPADCSSGGDTECDSEHFCDALLETPSCQPVAAGFWTEHVLPPEVVDGSRRWFHVASDGDDERGDGSAARPYRTLNRANLEARRVAGAYAGFYDTDRRRARSALSTVSRLHAAILLRRGDVFDARDERAFLRANGGDFDGDRSGGDIVLALEVSGEGPNARFMVLPYGPGGPDDHEGPRPVLRLTQPPLALDAPPPPIAGFAPVVADYGVTDLANWCPSRVLDDCRDRVRTLRHVTIAGVEIAPGPSTGSRYPIYYRDHLSTAMVGVRLRAGLTEDILLEDLYVHHVGQGVVLSHDYGLPTDRHLASEDLRLLHRDVRLRRCIFSETYSGRTGQGVATGTAARQSTEITYEECVFDENCWSPDLDVLEAYERGVYGAGLEVPTYGLDASGLPAYGAEANPSGTLSSFSYGAFTLGAAPHAAYIRHEAGGDFRVRGSMTLRGGTQNDKWNSGLRMASSLYLDNGIYLGAPFDNLADSTEGEGLTSARVVDSAFLGLSPHFGGTALSALGPVRGLEVRRNLFSRRGGSQRVALTLASRTGAPLPVSFAAGVFQVGSHTFTVRGSPPAAGCPAGQSAYPCFGTTIGSLCNFVNGLSDGSARCMLRTNSRLSVSAAIATFSGEVPAGDLRLAVFSPSSGGDPYFGAVQLETRHAILAYPTGWLEALRASGLSIPATWGSAGRGITVAQPGTGARGWLAGPQSVHDSGSRTHVFISQHGDALPSPPFEADGGPLELRFEGTEARTDAPVEVVPMGEVVVADNVFDLFALGAAEEPSATPRGHAIRVTGAGAPLRLLRNRFYAPVALGLGAVLPQDRADLLQLSPFSLVNIERRTNPEAPTPVVERIDYLRALWSEEPSAVLAAQTPYGIDLEGNLWRLTDEDAAVVGLGLPATASSTVDLYTSTRFESLNALCARDTVRCADQLVTGDAAWEAAGGAAPGALAEASLEGYRRARGLTLEDARYAGSTSQEREVQTLRAHVLRQRRGAWSETYDVYSLLGHLRERAGLPPIRRPYRRID